MEKTDKTKTTEQEKITNNNLPKTLLQAKTYSHFITIPQTTIDYEQLHKDIIATGKTTYLLTKLEQHEDEGLHIHLVIKYKEQIRVSYIHKVIMEQKGIIGGLIDYRKPEKLHASINYLKKEETSIEGKPYLETGTAPLEVGTNQHQKRDIQNTQLIEALDKAKQGDTEGALEDIRTIAPMDYLKFKNQIQDTLKAENKTRKKYTAPSFNINDVKLTPQQQKVWDLLQGTPQARRILWITGDYGSGKSFLYNYIKTNHEYGMYDAGQSASLDNVVYGYDEEGVIAWDLPRTFNFDDLGNSISSVIEKFSDFGQSITSKKYSGKTQKVLGHAIVFSNHAPLEQLQHRDIIHIDLSITEEKQEIKQEIPKHNKAHKKNIRVETANHKTPQWKIEEPDTDPDTEYMNDRELSAYYHNKQPIRQVKEG
jgi:hypothetical protein